MRIVLLGFMGCGKTAIGKDLAERIGFEFADLDLFIEHSTGTSIDDLFKDKGEHQFRELEHTTLQTLLNKDNVIIATGGGTPCFFNNMELINKSSVSVYVKMSVNKLFERLRRDQNSRPLVKDLAEKELKMFISDLLLSREPYYNMANYKVKAKELQVEVLAEFLKREGVFA
jgi:shikimate kinase